MNVACPASTVSSPWCCKEGGTASTAYSVSGTVTNKNTGDLTKLQAGFRHELNGTTYAVGNNVNLNAQGGFSFTGNHATATMDGFCYVRILDGATEVGKGYVSCYNGSVSISVTYGPAGGGGASTSNPSSNAGSTDCKSKISHRCQDYCKDNGGYGNVKYYYSDETTMFYREDCSTMTVSYNKGYCECGKKPDGPNNENCTKYSCKDACATNNWVSHNKPDTSIYNKQGVWYTSSNCYDGATTLDDAWCLCGPPDKPSPTPAPSADQQCKTQTGMPGSFCEDRLTGCGSYGLGANHAYKCYSDILGSLYCCMSNKIMLILNNNCAKRMEVSATDLFFKSIDPGQQGFADVDNTFNSIRVAIYPADNVTHITYKTFVPSGQGYVVNISGDMCN